MTTTEGVKRTVRLGSMVYIGPDGRRRRADCGDEIIIDAKHVERFDRLNVLQGAEVVDVGGTTRHVAPESNNDPEPKRRPGRPRKSEN